MEEFVKGDVVVIPFPFSDLSDSKRRPALVLANLEGRDLILCQITSQSVKDSYAIALINSGFKTGTLNLPSNIRPNRLFTAEKSMILRKVGKIKPELFDKVVSKLFNIIEVSK